MMKKQHYMTEKERYQLEAYLKAGKSRSWIARELGFSRKTIYNEIQRGLCHQIRWRGGYERDEYSYSADKAQQIHNYNQTAKGRPLKIGNDHAYADFLEDQILRQRRSPAAALAEARKAGHKMRICTTTLYSYIDKQIFYKLTNKHLWQKPKKRKKAEDPQRRVVHPKLPSIEIRPSWINDSSQPGHWEMDLVVGKTGTAAALLTLTERSSRREMIFKLPNRKAATVRGVFDQLEHSMGKNKFRKIFRSLTTDNGPEFLEYDLLRRSVYGGQRFEVYYCHSYSAWEKGCNENHNRMIRRWFPKGTDFTKVSKKRIAVIQDWMNNYPRKILNWKTPNEMAA